MSKANYIELTLLIERLHRRFLDVIKAELDSLKVEDINNVQTLILYNINSEQLTIGELTARGYYLGSNVSYNVKKLVENGYLVQERSPHDKRSTRIKLSTKGLNLCDRIDNLYQKHIDALSKGILSGDEMNTTSKNLKSLEKFWSEYIASLHKII